MLSKQRPSQQLSSRQPLMNTPVYYSTYEESTRYRSKENKNPRYSCFNLDFYTAGDEDQFEMNRNKTTIKDTDIDSSEYNKMNTVRVPELYHNLQAIDITHTFHYIFQKFKKGIFVQILDNQVSVLLPFSKFNYINEWGDKIKMPKMDTFKYIYESSGVKFNRLGIEQNVWRWYANNGIVRYERPIKENDSGIHMIYDMFQELCKHRKVPDMEFFINKRDFPILKKNKTEPYDYIFGDEQPLLSHQYDKYAPILSMCSTQQHADLLIPTWDDWSRVSVKEHKYFPKSSQEYKEFDFSTPWESRIPTAIFRGRSTGLGITRNTNPRVKVSFLSLEHKVDDDGMLFLDAGITHWNTRPRIIKGFGEINTFHPSLLATLPLVEYKSIEEQSKYKYIINIDGHSSAYRLSLELSTGSVVLKVNSNYTLWYSHLLHPYVHYVPIQSDLSDLYTQIQWCKEHDQECQQIALNAQQFYNTYLGKEYMMDYLQGLLYSIKKYNTGYKYDTCLIDYQRQHIRDLLQQFRFFDMLVYQNKRCYSSLVHTQYLLSQDILNESLYCSDDQHNKVIQYQGKQLFIKYNTHDKDEMLHDYLVGIYCINRLIQFIPNYSFTFYCVEQAVGVDEGERSKDHIIREHIDGITLVDYLHSPHFNIYTFLCILMQICLAIQTAQQTFLFVHGDLYPWNIILTTHKEKIEFTYYINCYKIRIKTDIIPIIIDYGKSNAIINGVYHCSKKFFFSEIHDMLSLLLSCLNELLTKRNLNKEEKSIVIYLSKFFTGTKFTQYKNLSTLSELKDFLYFNKKYSQMLYSDKYSLDKKNCIDFFFHLYNKYNKNIVIETVNTVCPMLKSSVNTHDNSFFNSCFVVDSQEYHCKKEILLQQKPATNQFFLLLENCFKNGGVNMSKAVDVLKYMIVN